MKHYICTGGCKGVSDKPGTCQAQSCTKYAQPLIECICNDNQHIFMKAVQINKYGGNDILEIKANAPNPPVNKGQVLVEVHAASINPVDWKLRSGYLKDWMPLKFPATLGGDFAGIITGLGDGVTQFKVGDEVYGSAITLNGGSGSFAENAAVNTANAAYKPKSVDFKEASALPLVGCSAVQAIEEHIKLQSGQKILIHGGAGGIGHVAIQLAKSLGAYVATTVSRDDMQFVKDLGADEAIDYKNQSFEQILKECDAVFDTVGGETTNRSFTVLKNGGTIVSMAGQPDLELAKKYAVTAIGQGTQTNNKHLSRLAQLVDNGKIKVHVDKVFSLDQVKEAFEYQEKSKPRGKVVIECKV